MSSAGFAMNVSSELLSRYVDGQVSETEADAVRQALDADPVIRGEFEELQGLDDLFGVSAGEPLPGEFLEQLCALTPVAPLSEFVPVAVDSDQAGRQGRGIARGIAEWGWGQWAAAAAVLFLTVFGIVQLTHRPDVTLHGFARYTLATDGSIVETNRARELTIRAGDTLRAGPNERLTFALADETRIALQPGGTIEIGDPRDGELLVVHGGTVLCSVVDAGTPRQVRAGDYLIAVRRAHFGVRVEGASVRAAGAGGSDVRVTVTVSRGSLEVARGATREPVNAYERVVLAPGQATERTHASCDPVFYALMHEYRSETAEVAPGYFRGEPGTTVIARHRWQRDGRSRVLTVTAAGESAQARFLVLQVDVDRATAFEVTRVVPGRTRVVPGRTGVVPGRAASGAALVEAVTVRTKVVSAGRHLVSVPLSAFSSKSAKRKVLTASLNRGRLARIKVRPVDTDARFELKNSLWAGREPVPEASRR